MKQQQFEITMGRDVKKTVTGYIFDRDGIKIGIDKRTNNINSSFYWPITELSTGCRLPFFPKTRREAIAVMDDQLLNIKEALS